MIYQEDLKNIEDIIKHLLGLYGKVVPYSKLMPQNKVVETLEDMLGLLVEIFTEEEKAILILGQSDDDYENRVRQFASMLMKELRPYHNQLKNEEKYKELCGKKYVAYGYFHSINESIDMMSSEEWNSLDEQYQKLLYLGLVDFYYHFYGRFYDNEEAIELLCKFYPAKIADELEEYAEKISATLYTHVSIAGTPNDFGYAYRGIQLIEEYINKLPPNIVFALLGNYSIYHLVNNKVFRHQLFTIIKYAGFDEDTRRRFKFWCLDSLYIANSVSMLYGRKLGEDGKKVEFCDDYDDYTLSKKRVNVFNEPLLYWDNDYREDRILFNAKGPIIRIELRENEVIVSAEKRDKPVKLKYKEDDWLLENYSERKTREEFRNLVIGTYSDEETDGAMLLSLVYLDNYRGLHHQVIDFDHRFVYHREKNVFEKKTDGAKRIPHFYGESVYSLSCIVGKNATGKTSIVDFLRETFFILLKYIEEQRVTCENGYVRETEYNEYEILDEGAKFMVIFSLEKQFYYITNIEKKEKRDEVDGVMPFSRGAYVYANELSKVAYFSNQLRNDQKELLVDEHEEKTVDEEQRKHRDIQKTNMDYRTVDYSEKKSFILKRRAVAAAKTKESETEKGTSGEKGINRDICYQLYFLKDKSPEEVREYIDIKEEKKLKLVSWMEGKKEQEISWETMKREEKFESYLEFAKLPDATIEHFSTGQYAKFSFLSKLQWFLEGGKKAIEQCNELARDYVFSNEEVMREDETAIIFIDEGETYYHPEWQRKYIKILLEMVNADPRKVQIVITTNSPFMISDILNDDIVYLSDDTGGNGVEKRKDERTLGQNIHTLLIDNFFMEYTIGEYARKLINEIISCLQMEGQNPENGIKERMKAYFGDIESGYDAMRLLIEQIGEPVYKYQLEEMLEKSFIAKQKDNEVARQISELEEEKRRLQKKIDELKERN